MLRFELAMTASPTRQAGARAAGVICVECLHCRHRGVLSDRALTRHGLSAHAPIASFVRRLTCERCGHHAVKAFRAPAGAARSFVAGAASAQR
jgi:hypothetical protein